MTVQQIALRLPRPLRSIHQIEISSQCNLACVYCPHGSRSTALGTEARPKQLMSSETFDRAMVWVQYLLKNPEQHHELNLAGLGESTIHPGFVELVRRARETVGDDVRMTVTSNGLLVTDDLVVACKTYNLGWFISLHRPEKAGPAVEILRKHDALLGVSNDPALAAVDWAGQVKWHVSAPEDRPCPWIRDGQGYVFADGRISTCAFDASALGVIGHVDNDPAAGASMAPYALCKKCDQQIGVHGYNQQRGHLPVLT